MSRKPEPDVRKSRKVAHTLWDMAKGKLEYKDLDPKLEEKKLMKEMLDLKATGTNETDSKGLYAVFFEMKKIQDNGGDLTEGKKLPELKGAVLSTLTKIWQAVHVKCISQGMWCKHTFGVAIADPFATPAANLLDNTKNTKDNIEQLFLVHDYDSSGSEPVGYLTLRTSFVRALETCIESTVKKDECYNILNFYKKFAARAHLEANKAVTGKHTLYDKYTDIASFSETLHLYNSNTGMTVPVKRWLDASSDNIIFKFNMKAAKFTTEKIVKMGAASAFHDIESIGFASDWATVRSSIPYVECLKGDQAMEKIKAGHHNQANYRLRKHLNTGDRQFLLCIKERHGLKLVVFLSETLFMKLAVMKHNNHPAQIFSLDTYVYDQERYDHPIENPIECTSRGGQIVLIAHNVQTMSLEDVQPAFTTKSHLQKVLGVDDHGVMLHQIYDELKTRKLSDKKALSEVIQSLTSKLVDDGSGVLKADNTNNLGNALANSPEFQEEIKTLNKILSDVR